MGNSKRKHKFLPPPPQMELSERIFSCGAGLYALIVSGAGLYALIVSPAWDDFLAGGPEQDGVFELGGVASLHVAEWWVRLNDSLLTEVLQCHLKQINKRGKTGFKGCARWHGEITSHFGINKKWRHASMFFCLLCICNFVIKSFTNFNLFLPKWNLK